MSGVHTDNLLLVVMKSGTCLAKKACQNWKKPWLMQLSYETGAQGLAK